MKYFLLGGSELGHPIAPQIVEAGLYLDGFTPLCRSEPISYNKQGTQNFRFRDVEPWMIFSGGDRARVNRFKVSHDVYGGLDHRRVKIRNGGRTPVTDILGQAAQIQSGSNSSMLQKPDRERFSYKHNTRYSNQCRRNN